jgi:hypothetical protein
MSVLLQAAEIVPGAHHRICPFMRIDLNIGGYGILIDEPGDYPACAWPLAPFDRFLAPSAAPPAITVEVEIVNTLPDLPVGPVRFDACHGLWTLFESNTGTVLECLDTQTLRTRIRATVDPDFSIVHAFVLEQTIATHTAWVPMHVISPLVELCLVTRIARESGILLHSAGVLSQTGGYVFTGPSGAGKSTVAQFFAERGASVLSDERMILRKHADGVIAYGTPWVGSGSYARNESGILTRLFCIGHGPRHHIESLSPTAVMSFLLPQCFLPHWDRPAMESTLAFVSELIVHVPCQRLSFRPYPDVVDYIQNHLTRTALVAS